MSPAGAVLSAGAERHAAALSERLVGRPEGMRTALGCGVDRRTAEGGDDGGDTDGRGGCAQTPAAGRGLWGIPYLALVANLFGGHATTVQAVHVSRLGVPSASVMPARLHSSRIDEAQSGPMGAANNEPVSSP